MPLSIQKVYKFWYEYDETEVEESQRQTLNNQQLRDAIKISEIEVEILQNELRRCISVNEDIEERYNNATLNMKTKLNSMKMEIKSLKMENETLSSKLLSSRKTIDELIKSQAPRMIIRVKAGLLHKHCTIVDQHSQTDTLASSDCNAVTTHTLTADVKTNSLLCQTICTQTISSQTQPVQCMSRHIQVNLANSTKIDRNSQTDILVSRDNETLALISSTADAQTDSLLCKSICTQTISSLRQTQPAQRRSRVRANLSDSVKVSRNPQLDTLTSRDSAALVLDSSVGVQTDGVLLLCKSNCTQTISSQTQPTHHNKNRRVQVNLKNSAAVVDQSSQTHIFASRRELLMARRARKEHEAIMIGNLKMISQEMIDEILKEIDDC